MMVGMYSSRLGLGLGFKLWLGEIDVRRHRKNPRAADQTARLQGGEWVLVEGVLLGLCEVQDRQSPPVRRNEPAATATRSLTQDKPWL